MYKRQRIYVPDTNKGFKKYKVYSEFFADKLTTLSDTVEHTVTIEDE